MQFHSDDTVAEISDDITVIAHIAPIGFQQTINGGDQKISPTHRRLKQPCEVQGLVSHISRKIEDEIYHLSPGEDRPAGFSSGFGHAGYGRIQFWTFEIKLMLIDM